MSAATPIRRRASRDQGMALLAVLWLVAALSAIAFTVAATVRAETERASTKQDSLRSYYLAQAGVYRAILWTLWGNQGFGGPDGQPMYFHAPMPRIHYEFPEGAVDVEVIPEESKVDINHATPENLTRLLLALGTPADRAQAIATGIVDWRTPTPLDTPSPDDSYYLSLTPSFRARHASIEEIEELALVHGMTPEIFYGGVREGPDGRLLPYGGLRDCVSVYGSLSSFDVNTVKPAVLSMLGMDGGGIRQLMQIRARQVIRSTDEIAPFLAGSQAEGKLRTGGGSITTFRATAHVRTPNGRFSDLERTVSATVKFFNVQQWDPPYHILRWYDAASSPFENGLREVPAP
jgi:general secretion pathway protein K